ncbi:MAG TPA: adenylate/guanylate cyclase domain-containing protein [Solirubrobacteraceae bacterium]|jgi:class 3 adenylate cyclase/tetratricopeptide (TPR) repeat protein|nr:adenylate/guanylate cyclase domain-containing protein [Solirubrobacteraceae bacterium]
MECRSCGAEIRAGKRFCVKCGTPANMLCPTCGAAADSNDRFCGECGRSFELHASQLSAPAPATRQSERRLVTVLFADLVGFTTLSEHRDPEEVRDVLSRYFDRCRTLIERYGGTVEKFIGDAVMAVWGTPVAREDDAERAVRAALALTQMVSTLGEEVGLADLRVRAGVLTGRAAVEVGAEGEGMVLGDTVNTASRLQSIATPGTVLADDVTKRASEAAIAYEDLGMRTVKGREQPVHAWMALRVVAGAGGARRSAGIEPLFVGRDRELELVIESSETSASQRRATLVSVIGAAGTGKSRLLWEYFKYIDGIEQHRWWHQGRCLSYGDGVAYWALAEMVRARAGIQEDEPPAAAREKLTAVVAEHVADERQRRLVEPRLAQLLGLGQRATAEAADLFSGWRLFFEQMAQTAPVILAFEDVHWADSGLLDFIDYMLDWSAEFPIFVLAVGRPEIRVRRPDWGTVQLGPLSSSAMRSLLDSVVPGLPADLTTRILDRAEGIPLYAVETVRMLLDRGVLVAEGNRYTVDGAVTDLEVPETLQALVAARLDNLPPRERELVQDAAVLGLSFFPAALAAVSGLPEPEVVRLLDTLVEKQVLGRNLDPRGGEEGQYYFLQALLRTIAVDTLSRRDRKMRHLAAAEYLRRTLNESGDIAEVLASHYLDAVEAEPDAPDVEEIRSAARETLAAAGRRAVSLAMGQEARSYFERAAELAHDEIEQAHLLAEAGAAAARTAELEAARQLLGGAIEVFDAAGRSEEAARTRALLATALIAENRLHEAGELIDNARPSLGDEDALAELAARRAAVAFLCGDFSRVFEETELALEIADPRGLSGVMSDALQTKGAALLYHRRFTEGAAVVELALNLALEGDNTEQVLRGYFNLGELRILAGELGPAAELLERGLGLARERGNRSWERDLLANRVGLHTIAGEWDEALALSEEMGADRDDDPARMARTYLPMMLAARGSVDALGPWLSGPESPSEWHELARVETVAQAVALRASGEVSEAADLVSAIASDLSGVAQLTYVTQLGETVDILWDAERFSLLEELVGRPVSHGTPILTGEIERVRARLLARSGDLQAALAHLDQALASLRRAGNPYGVARCQVNRVSVLSEMGTAGEGDVTAARDEAREIFGQLRAGPWIERLEGALAGSRAASAAD